MPPNASSTLVLSALMTAPPLPGTSYKFSFSTFAEDDFAATRNPAGSTVVPHSGPSGVRIAIRRKGRAKRFEKLGKSPRLVGNTQPVLSRARIRIRAVVAGPSGLIGDSLWNQSRLGRKPKDLGVARTDARGRFTLPPRTTGPAGRYGIIARSPGAPGLSPDFGCGPFFRIPFEQPTIASG